MVNLWLPWFNYKNYFIIFLYLFNWCKTIANLHNGSNKQEKQVLQNSFLWILKQIITGIQCISLFVLSENDNMYLQVNKHKTEVHWEQFITQDKVYLSSANNQYNKVFDITPVHLQQNSKVQHFFLFVF